MLSSYPSWEVKGFMISFPLQGYMMSEFKPCTRWHPVFRQVWGVAEHPYPTNHALPLFLDYHGAARQERLLRPGPGLTSGELSLLVPGTYSASWKINNNPIFLLNLKVESGDQ